MKMNIIRKDIRNVKTFKKYGEVFTQIRSNPETGWWLYERKNAYEVVRLKKFRNYDGSVVYTYPTENDWGIFGYTVNKNIWADKIIEFIMGAKNRTPQELYDFKMSLSTGNKKEIKEF